MNKFRRIGLRGRAVIFCVTLLCSAVVAISGTLIYLGSVVFSQTISQEGLALASSLSFNAEPAVLLNDTDVLNHVVRSAGRNENIALARVTDTQGRILAEFSQSHGALKNLSADICNPFGSSVHRDSNYIVQGDSGLLIVVPIWPVSESKIMELEEELASPGGTVAATTDTAIGFVQIVYSLDRVNAMFRNQVFASVGIALVVTLLGVFAVIFGSRQFLGPVADLVETSVAIAEGDLTRRAPEAAAGEVGVLARTFNHMADRLQESYASIERKVEQRTAELVRANKAKSDFLANMSHEIRTPLAAILGFTESLLDPDMSDAERVNAVSTIRRNGEHLLQIIGDILDISRIEAEQLQVECLECDVVQVIADVHSLMQTRAKGKGLTFEVDYAGPIPRTIKTDPTRLRQILINLLGNAIKFTEQGGVWLRVGFVERLDEKSRPQTCLQFDAIDTGIGMTPEQAAKIFKPFTQADETMTRRFGGTGLGLAISQRLAQMLGGYITLKTKPGRGSTFSVIVATGAIDGVPMLENPSEALSVKKQTASEVIFEPFKSACRVLLAEDGPDNQRLIAYLMRKVGAEVTVVDNGQLAVDAALAEFERDCPYDVILMDMQMPVMDGYEATSLLRAKGYRGGIIALTAHAMSGDREKCIAAGCDEYATKPIDMRALMQRIRKVISQRSIGASETAADGGPSNAASVVAPERITPDADDLTSVVDALDEAVASRDLATIVRQAGALKSGTTGQGDAVISETAARIAQWETAQADLESILKDAQRLVDLCRSAEAAAGESGSSRSENGRNTGRPKSV